MKNKLMVLCLIGLLAITACANRRLTYNTLASVGLTTRAAVDSYLDLVIAKKVSAETLPRVAQTYNSFQSTYAVAIAATQLGSNAPVTTPVLESSARVILTIKEAKGDK